MDARDASAMAWMYAGHCATKCGLKEHASRSSSRFGARVASRARRDGANNRGLTSSQLRDVWWFRRGLNVSSLARRAANDASTRFVAAWRRAASILDWASAVRAGLAFALAVTSGLRVVHVLRVRCVLCLLDGACLRHRRHSRQSPPRHRRDVVPVTLDGVPAPPPRHRRDTKEITVFNAEAAPERLARPRRVGRVLRVRLEVARELFPIAARHALEAPRFEAVLACVVAPSFTALSYAIDATRGTPAPRGRRTSSCAPSFWNSRRAAV